MSNGDTPSFTWLLPVTATPTDDLVEDPVDPLLQLDVSVVDQVAIAHPDKTPLFSAAEPDEINISSVQTIWFTPVCHLANVVFKGSTDITPGVPVFPNLGTGRP